MLNNEQFILMCNLVHQKLDGGIGLKALAKRRFTEAEVRKMCALVAKKHPLTREEALAQVRKTVEEAKANTPQATQTAVPPA